MGMGDYFIEQKIKYSGKPSGQTVSDNGSDNSVPQINFPQDIYIKKTGPEFICTLKQKNEIPEGRYIRENK